MKNPESSLFIPELAHVDIGVCQAIHNNVRNVYDHANRPEPWCSQQIKMYRPKMERLLKSLQPLRDYKLAQVTQLAVHQGRYLHSMILIMENNPLFSPQVEHL